MKKTTIIRTLLNHTNGKSWLALKPILIFLFLCHLLSLYHVILFVVLEAKVKYCTKAYDTEETQEEKIAIDDEC